jgi:hypothetical protein
VTLSSVLRYATSPSSTTILLIVISPASRALERLDNCIERCLNVRSAFLVAQHGEEFLIRRMTAPVASGGMSGDINKARIECRNDCFAENVQPPNLI